MIPPQQVLLNLESVNWGCADKVLLCVCHAQKRPVGPVSQLFLVQGQGAVGTEQENPGLPGD